MIQVFKSVNHTLSQVEKEDTGCWINIVAPTEAETRELVEKYPFLEHYISDTQDIDEKARIERDEDLIFILLRIPHFIGIKEDLPFNTIPLGVVMTNDYIFTICKEDNVIIEELEKGRVKGLNPAKKYRFLLLLLLKIANKFLNHLREINKIVEGLEDSLQASMRNKELLELLKFQKILVYYTTGLKSNELVVQRLHRSNFFNVFEADEDLIEEVIIEFQQAIEMTNISNNILTQMMGAYASIINNNMNVVIKFLTLITIAIAFPTLIASIFGMNVPLPGSDNPLTFPIIMAFSLIVSIGTILIFYKRRWF